MQTTSLSIGLSSGGGGDTTELVQRIAAMEDTTYEYELWQSIGSGTSGTISIPEGAVIRLDQYPNAGDCLIVKCDAAGRPVDEPAGHANGTAITATLDTSGQFVLSGVPKSYPVAIVFQVALPQKAIPTIPLDSIVGYQVVRYTDAQAAAAAPVQAVAGKTGSVVLTKADVGLGSVDNTADADKPISVATQSALDTKAENTHSHTTDVVAEGSANLYFTAQRVRDVVLTGLSTATNAAIAAADSVLVAFGKLQAQITGHIGNTTNAHGMTTPGAAILRAATETAQRAALGLANHEKVGVSAAGGVSAASAALSTEGDVLSLGAELGSGIRVNTRMASLPTTGTRATVAWLDNAAGHPAGSLLLQARPGVGRVILSSSGAGDVVVYPNGELKITTSYGVSSLGGASATLAGEWCSLVSPYAYGPVIRYGNATGANLWQAGILSQVGATAYTIRDNTNSVNVIACAAGGDISIGRRMSPLSDNSFDLGRSTLRFGTAYFATNPVVGSDARLKCDYSVIPGDIAHELMLKIVPRVGKFIVGGQQAYEVEEVTTNEAGEEVTQKVTRYREVPGNRYHTYYLAQEVKAALDAVADRWPQAANLALWLLSDVEDVDSIQMIRYEQMIPIIHAASNYRHNLLIGGDK